MDERALMMKGLCGKTLERKMVEGIEVVGLEKGLVLEKV